MILSWDCANHPTASPSSTVVPVSVPPTLPVSFPSSKRPQTIPLGVARCGEGAGKEKWKPAQSSTGFLYSACMSSADQLFPHQFKDLVGMKKDLDTIYPRSLRRGGEAKGILPLVSFLLLGKGVSIYEVNFQL